MSFVAPEVCHEVETYCNTQNVANNILCNTHPLTPVKCNKQYVNSTVKTLSLSVGKYHLNTLWKFPEQVLLTMSSIPKSGGHAPRPTASFSPGITHSGQCCNYNEYNNNDDDDGDDNNGDLQ